MISSVRSHGLLFFPKSFTPQGINFLGIILLHRNNNVDRIRKNIIHIKMLFCYTAIFQHSAKITGRSRRENFDINIIFLSGSKMKKKKTLNFSKGNYHPLTYTSITTEDTCLTLLYTCLSPL